MGWREGRTTLQRERGLRAKGGSCLPGTKQADEGWVQFPVQAVLCRHMAKQSHRGLGLGPGTRGSDLQKAPQVAGANRQPGPGTSSTHRTRCLTDLPTNRPPGSSYFRYAESSMKNSFGLKYLHKFFNIPFLQLQVSPALPSQVLHWP